MEGGSERDAPDTAGRTGRALSCDTVTPIETLSFGDGTKVSEGFTVAPCVGGDATGLESMHRPSC